MQRSTLLSLSLSLACLTIVVSDSNAQELGAYDLADFSGGIAEGAYGPSSDEQLYPYDSVEPWIHGYIQYMPYYGGFTHFRPYNYKHVFSQTQTASGWGMSPKMPYSQQYWHRYHKQSRMTGVPIQPTAPAPTMVPQHTFQPQPAYPNISTQQQYPLAQPAVSEASLQIAPQAAQQPLLLGPQQ